MEKPRSKPLPRRPDEEEEKEVKAVASPANSISKASKLLGTSNTPDGVVVNLLSSSRSSGKAAKLLGTASEGFIKVDDVPSVFPRLQSDVTILVLKKFEEDGTPKAMIMTQEAKGDICMFTSKGGSLRPTVSFPLDSITHLALCDRHSNCFTLDVKESGLVHFIFVSSGQQQTWMHRLVNLTHLNTSNQLLSSPALTRSSSIVLRAGRALEKVSTRVLQLKNRRSPPPLRRKTGQPEDHSVMSAADLGNAKRKEGFQPGHPIVLVPGLASSALIVEESIHQPSWQGTLLWMSLQKLSTSKVKRVAKQHVLQRERRDTVRIREGNDFIRHICLSSSRDGLSDPEGIRVRPVPGVAGCAYLAKEKILASVSYVMGSLIESLKALGYEEEQNLFAATYDWRIPIAALEARDGYFSNLEEQLEHILKTTGRPAILLGHSNGNRVIQYFMQYAKEKKGLVWITKHVHGYIAVGAPFLGAPKGIRCLTSGDRMGLEMFLSEEEGHQFIRGCGSVGAILPDGDDADWKFPWQVPAFVYIQEKKQYLSALDAISRGGVNSQLSVIGKFYENDRFWGGKKNSVAHIDVKSFMSEMEARLQAIPKKELDALLQDWRWQVSLVERGLPITSAFPSAEDIREGHCPCCEDSNVPVFFVCKSCLLSCCINCICNGCCHICKLVSCPFTKTQMGENRPILAPPPISRMWNIYGINRETEIAYFMVETETGLKLDSSADLMFNFPGFKIGGGVVYETQNTPQNGPKGFACSGDGTVPFASLSYPAKKWGGSIGKLKTIEIPGAEHREILRHPRFLEAVLDIVAEEIDVASSWKQLVSWVSTDTFANTAWSLPWCRKCGHKTSRFGCQYCTACMAPMLPSPHVFEACDGFLYETGACTPCLVLDLGEIEAGLKMMAHDLTEVTLDYQVLDFLFTSLEILDLACIGNPYFRDHKGVFNDVRMGWAAAVLGKFSWFEAKRRAVSTDVEYACVLAGVIKFYLIKLPHALIEGHASLHSSNNALLRLLCHLNLIANDSPKCLNDLIALFCPIIFRIDETSEEQMQMLIEKSTETLEVFPRLRPYFQLVIERFCDDNICWFVEYFSTQSDCQHYLVVLERAKLAVGVVSLSNPNPYIQSSFPCRCLVFLEEIGYRRHIVEQNPSLRLSPKELVNCIPDVPVGSVLIPVDDLLLIDDIAEFARSQIIMNYEIHLFGEMTVEFQRFLNLLGEQLTKEGTICSSLFLDREGKPSLAAEVAFQEIKITWKVSEIVADINVESVAVVFCEELLEGSVCLSSMPSCVNFVIYISPMENEQFHIQCAAREGMRPFRPFVPYTAVIEAQYLSMFLAFKCVNAVRSCQLMPGPAKMSAENRKRYLASWYSRGEKL